MAASAAAAAVWSLSIPTATLVAVPARAASARGPATNNPQGGGGLGAGGAIFAMAGATLTIVQDAASTAGFSNNTVAGGAGANNGSAYGKDLFLGAGVTFNVQGAGTLSVDSLGGAGNLADTNVSGNANDPNAQGGLTKQGTGTLTVTGASYYVGQTQVQQGALVLATGASEVGTSAVVVGTTGDAALVLQGNSSIGQPAPGVAIVLGQNSGVQGTLTIGNGGKRRGNRLRGRDERLRHRRDQLQPGDGV